MGYTVRDQSAVPPVIIEKDETGTTSWRDAKKALRQWYLDEAKKLRSITEKDYFNNNG